MGYKLSSLTIFFPFYNDAETVQSQISSAYKYGCQVTDQLTVIAIHGGASHDQTWSEILQAKRDWPQLQVIDKSDNTEGYGVIKYGFMAAQTDWVFYTDGDAQYDLSDLPRLVRRQHQTQADVVNGYKTNRQDNWRRRLFGTVFQFLHRRIIGAPIRDIHCDFRLIRRKYLAKIKWTTKNSTVISETILKLVDQGATFTEIGVVHGPRQYGQSNYDILKLAREAYQEIVWSLQYQAQHRKSALT